MIKRTATFLLILLYVVTTCGLVVNAHYCGRLLVSVQVNAESKKCIGESTMKGCHDMHFEAKIKDAHQNAAFSFSAKTFVFDLPAITYEGRFFNVQPIALSTQLQGRAPPNYHLNEVPVFIKTCNFRI